MSTKKKADTKKKEAPKKEKKVEITNDTKVRVYNNRLHRVNFKLAGGNTVVLSRLGEYREVRVEDLEMILSDAEAMLKEGTLIIKNVDVQKYLGIDKFYKEGVIIEGDKLEDLLNKDTKELKGVLEKASNTAIDDLHDIAQDNISNLMVGQIELIEKYSGRKLILQR